MTAWEQLKQDFPWPKTKPEPPTISRECDGWLCDDTKTFLGDACCRDGVSTIIEVGSWAGLSTRFMLDINQRAKVVCIDTWKGSVEHFKHEPWAKCLPHIYDIFLQRCWDYKDRIVPLMSDSVVGLTHCFLFNIIPDVIYIDGSHEFRDVYADILTARNLFPDATLVGDDANLKDVNRAVEYALLGTNRYVISRNQFAWRLRPKKASNE